MVGRHARLLPLRLGSPPAATSRSQPPGDLAGLLDGDLAVLGDRRPALHAVAGAVVAEVAASAGRRDLAAEAA